MGLCNEFVKIYVYLHPRYNRIEIRRFEIFVFVAKLIDFDRVAIGNVGTCPLILIQSLNSQFRYLEHYSLGHEVEYLDLQIKVLIPSEVCYMHSE